MDNKQDLTNNYGRPVENDTSSLTVGEFGPTLIIDTQLTQKLAHLDHERIPERVAFARGAGAYGVFETTKSMIILKLIFYKKKAHKQKFSFAFQLLFYLKDLLKS